MNISEIVKGASKIAITGHVRPDGDCIGSTLALYNFLKLHFSDIQTDIYLEPFDSVFLFLPGAENIKHESVSNEKYDVFFVCDCASKDRIRPFASMFDNAAVTVCIDHHVSNTGKFADVSKIIPDASSTCEVLYGLLPEDLINKSIAMCLYTGIIHDTGVFKYSCTSTETLRVAAKLIEFGFDFTDIIDNTFYSRTYNGARALGIVLERSRLYLDGQLICSYITPDELSKCDTSESDMSGIVEQLMLTAGAEAAAFIYPSRDFTSDKKSLKKVSLRSKHIADMSALAAQNGGGGHVRAAGYSSYKSYDEITDEIKSYVDKCIKEADKEK